MKICEMDYILLLQYVDGTIDPLEKLLLEEHIRTCNSCRRELNRLKILEWDLYHAFHEDIAIPQEVTLIRYQVLEKLRSVQEDTIKDVTEENMTMKDIISLQASTINNSLKFISLIPFPGKPVKNNKPVDKKKRSLLSKIIGI